MKRVITYGTFDLLHYGHINLLRRAKALGDYLIVGLSTDQFNWQEKQKKSYFTYEERKAMLEAIRYVVLAIAFNVCGKLQARLSTEGKVKHTRGVIRNQHIHSIQ